MTRRTRTATRTRSAFTLVELLVVVTVLLVIMAILAQAVTIITNTIRDVKAQGDFVGAERAALEVLKRDLQADHFLDEDSKPNQGRKLSNQRLDQMFVYNNSGWKIGGYTPPKSGYFWAASRPVTNASNAPLSTWNLGDDSTWNFYEGSDGDGFNSSRTGNHFLQFTVLVPGGAPGNTMTADVPFQNNPNTNTYPLTGTAAEVAYFLRPNGFTPAGVAKYMLVRRQRLCARTGDDASAYSSALASIPPLTPPGPGITNDASEVMAVNTGTTVLSMADLTLQPGRIGGGTIPRIAIAEKGTGSYAGVPLRAGEDVLNYNVTSFEVKFTGTGGAATTTSPAMPAVQWPTTFANGNTDYPYDTLPFDGVFDTFNSQTGWDASTNLAVPGPSNPAPATNPNTAALKRIRITGVMVRLRYWNQSTKSTRQTTIAVDL